MWLVKNLLIGRRFFFKTVIFLYPSENPCFMFRRCKTRLFLLLSAGHLGNERIEPYLEHTHKENLVYTAFARCVYKLAFKATLEIPGCCFSNNVFNHNLFCLYICTYAMHISMPVCHLVFIIY